MTWPGNYFVMQAMLRSVGFDYIDICANPDQICQDGFIAFLLGKSSVSCRYIRYVRQSFIPHSLGIVFIHHSFIRDRLQSSLIH